MCYFGFEILQIFESGHKCPRILSPRNQPGTDQESHENQLISQAKQEEMCMGRRSDFRRRPHDAYHTIDPRAVRSLKPYLYGVRSFAEPCAGDRDLVDGLEAIGLKCVQQSDLKDGTDALQLTCFNRADAIITNPPWTRQLLHPLILHFSKHLPTWLLYDSDWAYNKMAVPYLDQCSDIIAVGRLRWIEGTTQTGKDNVSWYRFWHQHRGSTRFHGRKR
jgi:hypothetical protein